MAETLEKLVPPPARGVTPADEVGLSEFLDDYKRMSLPSPVQPLRCRIVVDRTLAFVHAAEMLWLGFRATTALSEMKRAHPTQDLGQLAETLPPEAWLPPTEPAPGKESLPSSLALSFSTTGYAFDNATMHYFRTVFQRSNQGTEAQIKNVLKALATFQPMPPRVQESLERLLSTHLTDTITAALAYGCRLDIDSRLQLHLALGGLNSQVSLLVTNRAWESLYYWALEASAGMVYGLQEQLKLGAMPSTENGWHISFPVQDMLLNQRYIPIPDLSRSSVVALDHWSRILAPVRRRATKLLADPAILDKQVVPPAPEPDESI